MPVCTKASTGQRVVSGAQGIVNIGLGELKTAGSAGVGVLSVAGSPETGGASLLALPVAAYGVISGQGQVASGAGQIFTAVTGNSQVGEQIQEVGSIVSGPIAGTSTLLATGNPSQAATAGNYESYATTVPGMLAIPNSPPIQAAASFIDNALSAVGLVTDDCGEIK